MNLLPIKDIAEKKGIAIIHLAEAIEMSPQNLHRCIRINQIQGHQLEIIAKLLEVPIWTFFDEKPEVAEKTEKNLDYKIMYEAQKKEIQLLKERIQDKQQIIDLLQKQAAPTDAAATCAAAGGQQGA